MSTTITNGILNLETVAPGIWRGGQPNDTGWNWLKSSGVTRVIKVNTAGEAQDVAPEALGMQLVYCPIDLDDQLIFRPSTANVNQAVDAIQPSVFIHCSHGQDRTGLIVGVYRVRKCGWTKHDAWKEMMANGFHPELLGLFLFWEWSPL